MRKIVKVLATTGIGAALLVGGTSAVIAQPTTRPASESVVTSTSTNINTELSLLG